MLDHVSAKVSDVPAAKGFYEQLFAPLGVQLMMDGAEEGWCGFGTGSGTPQFWITNTEGRGAAHFAFTAPDRATVDEISVRKDSNSLGALGARRAPSTSHTSAGAIGVPLSD